MRTPLTRARILAVVLAACALTGCLAPRGLLFTRVVRPVDLNFERTPVYTGEATANWHTLQYYVQIDWGSNGLGDVAKRHGFTRVHYADLETLSILGVYTQRKLHVYGER